MYAHSVTSMTGRATLRHRLYEAYASQHSGCDTGVNALVYRRDIRSMLPAPEAGPVFDIGCGQGALVRLLLNDGYDAAGVDISPEQVAIAHSVGLVQVQAGDYRDILGGRVGEFAAITATDVLEHLTKNEVLETFDYVASALAPGGVFVARVPNAGSPFGGHIRHGDFTHESWYTDRSVRQLSAATGFASVTVLGCPPIAHGLASAARVVMWRSVSALCKIALAAETGVLSGHIVTQNLTFVARKAG